MPFPCNDSWLGKLFTVRSEQKEIATETAQCCPLVLFYKLTLTCPRTPSSDVAVSGETIETGEQNYEQSK